MRDASRMRLLTLALLIFPLAACDSPSPAMMGQEATRVVVDGAEFSVRQNGNRAEAIRTNTMAFPAIGAIVIRAEQAMEQATGCEVDTDTLRATSPLCAPI
ncbi:MAG TPA: hypothetical protein EYP31_09560 [Roseibacterium sp.]|nr:hypothetical protein [Roseibacterium sp.]